MGEHASAGIDIDERIRPIHLLQVEWAHKFRDVSVWRRWRGSRCQFQRLHILLSLSATIQSWTSGQLHTLSERICPHMSSPSPYADLFNKYSMRASLLYSFPSAQDTTGSWSGRWMIEFCQCSCSTDRESTENEPWRVRRITTGHESDSPCRPVRPLACS